MGLPDHLTKEETTISQYLEERYRKEEILCKQKSSVQWLKEGEKH